MPDYDKIIEHLWEAVCVPHYDNAGNAWEYPKEVQDAANAAIEAIDSLTTPRVMTFEELYVDSDESVICYIEFRDKDAINVTAPFRYPGDNLIQIPYIGTECRKWAELKQYGKTWRCWTAKPTDGQRKAVAWVE